MGEAHERTDSGPAVVGPGKPTAGPQCAAARIDGDGAGASAGREGAGARQDQEESADRHHWFRFVTVVESALGDRPMIVHGLGYDTGLPRRYRNATR